MSEIIIYFLKEIKLYNSCDVDTLGKNVAPKHLVQSHDHQRVNNHHFLQQFKLLRVTKLFVFITMTEPKKSYMKFILYDFISSS